MQHLIFLLFTLVLTSISYGTKTYSHQETSWSDWREGSFQNVIFEDTWRTLSLGPTCTKKIVLEDPSIDHIESLGENGFVIATDGENGAKLRRVYSDGSHALLQEGLSGASFTFAVSRDGSYIYFASHGTSKIYRLKLVEGAMPECIATLKVSSIEKIVLSNQGRLYILTEAPAAIFEIDPSTPNQDDLKSIDTFSDVPRIKELVFDEIDNSLYAVADNRGLLYALKKQFKKLLLQLKSEEITGIAVVNGEIYFTTLSEKNNMEGASSSDARNEKKGLKFDSAVAVSFSDNPKALNPSLIGKCYRMKPNGMPECLYTVRDEGIASITPHFEDGVLLGLSHSGKVIHLKSNRHWRLLADLPSGRYISRIMVNQDQSLLIASSLPGAIYEIDAGLSAKATFLSKPFDAGQIMRFGQFQPIGFSLDFLNSKTQLSVRTGNCEDPNETWNDWQNVAWGAPLDVEPARFIQYRIEWKDKDFRFNGLKFYYTDFENLAPTIFHAQVHMADFEPQMMQDPNSQNATFSFGEILSRDELTPSPPSFFNLNFRKLLKKNWVSCFWYAEDPNNDELTYTVSIKPFGVLEEGVTVVKDISHPLCSMETKSFSDGYYQFQIIASDESDNGQGHLTAVYETEPFMIDNESPFIKIGDIVVHAQKHLTTIKVSASDQWSPIIRASYSLDKDQVNPMAPVTGMWDSQSAEFEISFTHLAPGQHTLQVSVEDERGNMGVAVKTFKISAKDYDL